ncbi:6-hydroxycyclohex-1-ene-1-carbonyl-CoA dehydrogenase [Thauera phenylacetica]|jgi:6-hydroxycyclohex-1-ene-1-carbonyl-CoA dehydrogenase|uniref:6-hydroxycyclohex-1-ene-1-carbonyl-CoA dehydrogenase n=1 Tax=Thauera phenylacetica B4P TaxID=1234382 RepID=N6ZUM2_9RHOO|nr:6-hydroxycyclohex-1-ene-1-carbonyl-CoA dehydrogenase [Thauera phenylacetica]ENO98033.1 6-hydroxycyclohex-1-ene-1-carbonyl-CoA dehydrogenase [Thauera phenylacetica B4P]MBP7639150.1 6-hydroxycyclohex-1-ene-1-carbonyl-CoA dehydrogenase [Thauera sp.]HRM67873.1 6-hydroxycyclohex-1-ene-1-carbonyl-CoA dehydrogenase [Thauera phenylacetica]
MSTKPYRWMMVEPGRPMVRTEFEIGELAADQVVVEVAGCGVCHTDLGYYYDGVRTNQPLPLALGHEISGRVVNAGSAAGQWVGRAVIVPAVMPCGTCELCTSGHGTICRAQVMPGNDIQGGFASHIVVPARGLCAVDEQRLAAAGLQLADVSVVADAVTTPYQAVTQAGVEPGDVAIVIGVGGVGGYAVQIANAFGASVVAIDVDPAKLELMSKYGAALTLNAREVTGRDLKKAIEAHAKANGLRTTRWKIFECSGSGAGQTNAYSLINHGATLAVVGFTMDKVEVRLSNLMAFHARALGNWGCLPEYYPPALDLVLDGRINLANFVERHPLAQINEVFEAAHAHKLTRRAILTP